MNRGKQQAAASLAMLAVFSMVIGSFIVVEEIGLMGYLGILLMMFAYGISDVRLD